MAMHHIPTRAIALVGALAFCPAVAGLSAQDQSAQAVVRLEETLGVASMNRDGATVANMLSEDFTFTAPDGQVLTKAQLVTLINSDSTEYVSGVGSEMKARTHGTTVVVTGLWTEKVKTQAGTIERRYRYTDTWVKGTDGQWLCIAGHSMMLAPA